MLISFFDFRKSVKQLSVVLCLSCSCLLFADELKNNDYLELGLLTSSMTVIQPSIGYWWGRSGVRLTGLYLSPDRYNFYVNMAYELKSTAQTQHSINLLTSWITGSDPGADYKYAATGVAYSLNYRGFFVELGLAVPWRDEIGNLANDPVIPSGYLGYIYRFH